MKTVEIKVVPNARKNEIVDADGKLKVYVTSPAVDGKANRDAIALLADFFGVKKKDITIVSGGKSRKKVIRIESI